MKKSFFALFLGVLFLGFSADTFAQGEPFFTGNVGPSTTNSVTFSQGSGAAGTTGTVITAGATSSPVVLPPFSLFTGNIVTYNLSNGMTYSFMIVASPSANPAIALETDAEQFLQLFFPSTSTINGMQVGDALQLVNLDLIPFDFGLSAVLGAGALGAVRAARKRKAQAKQAVA